MTRVSCYCLAARMDQISYRRKRVVSLNCCVTPNVQRQTSLMVYSVRLAKVYVKLTDVSRASSFFLYSTQLSLLMHSKYGHILTCYAHSCMPLHVTRQYFPTDRLHGKAYSEAPDIREVDYFHRWTQQ